MALKDTKGCYHRPVAIEAINIMHGTASIRMHMHDSETDRQENEANPWKNYHVECAFPENMVFTLKTIPTKKAVQQLMYSILAEYKVVKEEIKHEATEEKEAWVETVYEYPFSDYTNC